MKSLWMTWLFVVKILLLSDVAVRLFPILIVKEKVRLVNGFGFLVASLWSKLIFLLSLSEIFLPYILTIPDGLLTLFQNVWDVGFFIIASDITNKCGEILQ